MHQKFNLCPGLFPLSQILSYVDILAEIMSKTNVNNAVGKVASKSQDLQYFYCKTLFTLVLKSSLFPLHFILCSL